MTTIWLVLMSLTAAGWLAGENDAAGPIAAALLLAAAVIKGRLVIEHFMGLAEVRPLWRWTVLGWLYLTVALIGLAYWLGLQ